MFKIIWKKETVSMENKLMLKVKLSYLVSAVALLACLYASPAMGQGFRIPAMGPAALGQGNAFVATADDPSAVFYNPAGLTQMDNLVAAQGGLNIMTMEAKNKTQHFKLIDNEHFIPFGYVSSYLGTPRLRLAYGAFSEYGISTTYHSNTPMAFISKKTELTTINHRIVLAYELFKWLSFGGGIDIIRGNAQLKSNLPFSLTEIGEMKMRGSGTAVSWNGAVLLKPHKRHSLGFAFRSQTDLYLDGHANFEGIPSTLSPSSLYSADASTEIKLPVTLTFGYAFRPLEKLKLEYNLQWIRYDTHESLDLKTDAPFLPFLSIPTNYDNILCHYLGAEYITTDWLKLRCGWAHMETPIPGSTYNGMVPTNNQNAATLGLGLSWRNLGLDAAWAIIPSTDRKVDNMVGYPYTSINGNWTNLINMVSLAATVKY